MPRHKHKPVKTLKGLKHEFGEITSWATGDTRFMAKAMLFMATQNEKMLKILKKKESDGSVFIKYKMRFEDMGFIDALNAWKNLQQETKKENPIKNE